MNATHTKGPWEARNGEVTTRQIEGRSFRRIAAVQDYGIGSLPEVDEANARLIAAAPDLLAAAEAVIASDALIGNSRCAVEAFDAMRKAIAKATGRD